MERLRSKWPPVPLAVAALGAGALLATAAAPAAGATNLLALRYSFDTAVQVGATVAEKRHLVADDLAGSLSVMELPGIPAGAAIDAYHRLPNGHQLFSLDVTAELPGGVIAQPADVVRWDGASYTIELAATAAGIPAGANVDAVTVAGGDLVVSFDVTVALGGVTVGRSDLARWEGTSWSLFLEGGAHGVPAGLVVDAAHALPNGKVLLSFDGAGELGGVFFSDEDVVELDPAAGTWSLAFQGTSHSAAWARAGLDALWAEADPLLFADGFESGGTTAWSATVP